MTDDAKTAAEKAAEALEWALAEIEGMTRYTSAEQFENARSCALEALAALRSPPANPTVGVEAEVGPGDMVDKARAWDMLAEKSAKLKSAEALADRLKLEAQCHATEARGANATIAEIYQVCTGSTGEPGNWHGAEPVKKAVSDLRARAEAAEKEAAALRDALEATCEWILRLPIPTPGATGRLVKLRAALNPKD